MNAQEADLLTIRNREMNKTHFFNKEDAMRHAMNYGGKVMDNTHNNNKNVGNNYTVVGDVLSKASEFAVVFTDNHLMGRVEMTKEMHESWMESKGWPEDIKEMHRGEFRRCDKNKFNEANMLFDGMGSFSYIYT